MEDFEEALKQTIRQRRRQQDPLNPQKHTYTRAFDHLVQDNTHIVVVVLFRYRGQGIVYRSPITTLLQRIKRRLDENDTAHEIRRRE